MEKPVIRYVTTSNFWVCFWIFAAMCFVCLELDKITRAITDKQCLPTAGTARITGEP